MDSIQNNTETDPQEGETKFATMPDATAVVAALDTSSVTTAEMQRRQRLAGSTPAKLSTKPNQKKYVNVELKNTQGAFLVRYNKKGAIEAFLGGAMRTQVDKDHDEVVIMSPDDLTRAFIGNDGKRFLPQPKTITLTGEARRRPYRVRFHSNEYFEFTVTSSIPEGCMWGLLSIYPSPTRFKVGAVYNGINHEEYLDPRTWRQLETEDGRILRVESGGGGDINARLSEKAVHYASTLPTSWNMTTYLAETFGGLKGAPVIPGMPDDAVTYKMISRELKLRKDKDVEAQMRKARQYAEKRAGQRHGGTPARGTTLGDALPSETAAALKRMEMDIIAMSGRGNPAEE